MKNTYKFASILKKPKNREMQKTPFQITASQQGSVAHFRIIGYIGWETAAEQFRREADEMVAAGCKIAHLYIKSEGGSCFDADEIVNILQTNFNSFTGESGALVASSASNIASYCETFVMPENAKMMIHKPRGGVSGTASEIASYAKGVQDFEDQYYQKYLSKSTDKKDFKEKWNAGDYWLTAKEAKAAGFATEVRKSVTIDKETQAMIEACASSTQPPKNTNTNTIKKMEHLKSIAAIVGLTGEFSVESVGNSVKAILAAKENLEGEKTVMQARLVAYETAEKAKLTAEAVTLVAAAQKDGRTDDKGSAGWLTFFENNHEGAKAALAAVPTPESVVDRIKAAGAGGETKGNAWAERQKEIDEANK